MCVHRACAWGPRSSGELQELACKRLCATWGWVLGTEPGPSAITRVFMGSQVRMSSWEEVIQDLGKRENLTLQSLETESGATAEECKPPSTGEGGKQAGEMTE